MFVSEVILKLVLALIRWTKYCCTGYWLKNWKQSDPGARLPLYCPRPSNGRLPLLTFGTLFGHTCGGAPNCKPGSVIGRAGRTGGMGSGSTNTLAGCGLQPRLQPPLKQPLPRLKLELV